MTEKKQIEKTQARKEVKLNADIICAGELVKAGDPVNLTEDQITYLAGQDIKPANAAINTIS